MRESSSNLLEGNPLEKRREALERGAGGDYDRPYRFSLPAATPEVFAWVKLLARVRHGDLQAEVAAAIGAESGGSNTYAAYPLMSPVHS